MKVCATTHAFHTFLNPHDGQLESVFEKGLRPLSDFPESERWQQIQQAMPGFFENLYEMIAKPVLQKPYSNSGVFISPIDFQLLPNSIMHNRTRIKIPFSRIDPEYAVLTYVLNEERITLPLTEENLSKTAEIWTDTLVTEWFGKDQSKIFFYVPQIATYQPDGIHVEAGDLEKLG